ncbi:MAG: ATP-dependent DNA helicase, partial [Gammaproteobacteria bacterium]
EVLGVNGLLSQAITGFTPRESQQVMADAIEKTLSLDSQLIVEAGTGTGKTFGYLVPIFLAQKKTIISTGTKNLQDQLFFKDIPIIKKILSFTLKVVLLKGRANYLCKHRLERNIEDGRFVSRQLVSELHTINEWASATQAGDISELNSIPEDSLIWPQVTSTPDNCLSQDCPFYKNCFVVQARQQALNADIVIVNHHLFFADMALQEDGFGELLPGADAIVFDEAHHLPDIASQFFSTSVTGRQIIELARDTEAEVLLSAKDMREIIEEADKLQAATHEMRVAMGMEIRRAPWPEQHPPLLEMSIQCVKKTLQSLEENLRNAAVRSKGLENCWRRAALLIARFNLLTGKTPEDTVHWFETYAQSFSVQLTPMIVADNFKQYIEERKRAWIFTSATLTVKNNFSLFVETLGLKNALQLQLKSPFDYQKQSLLYVPRGLPDPHAQNYTESLVEAAIPVLEATQGKAFLLFTSYKAMEYAAELLKNRISFPMLLQGTMPKKELIDQFKQLGNAVLLGTSSFWYGVDVRGDALSCVIIDKLPFAAPEDPILKARIQMLRKQGTDPFQTYQLPNAVLILKQGAGRLIRDIEDRGILMICDPRLVGSRYGEAFLQSLPDMRRTRDLEKVREFMAVPVAEI